MVTSLNELEDWLSYSNDSGEIQEDLSISMFIELPKKPSANKCKLQQSLWWTTQQKKRNNRENDLDWMETEWVCPSF